MKSAQRLFSLFFLLVLSLVSSGCKEFYAALPAVIPIVTNSLLLIDQIADFADKHFGASPDAAKQKEVATAVSNSRAALMEAQKQGKDAENQDAVNKSFDGFKAEYAKLLKACEPIPGFKVAPAGTEVVYGASPDTLVVPSPEALTQ